MVPSPWTGWLACLAIALGLAGPARGGEGVAVSREGTRVRVSWPMADAEFGRFVLDVAPGKPLIESLGIAGAGDGAAVPLLAGVDPVVFLTVGSRESPSDRPPGMSVFNVFFDNPASRPSQRYQGRLDPRRAEVVTGPGRASVVVGDLTAGPFRGSLRFTVYAGARLLHVEALLTTGEDRRAYVHDMGLAGPAPGWTGFAWTDTEGRPRREPAPPDLADRALAVRHRLLVAETPHGSVACFPPPHSFFYPRDYTDNQATVWAGRGHRGSEPRPGFGVRQTETGGGNFVPWFNAPPGTEQRLGVFFLLSRGDAQAATAEALRFTNGDRFPDLPGHVTFTSHWHLAVTEAARREKTSGRPRTTPDFVGMLKALNVRAIHLAEFHGDGHPRDPGPLRLAELKDFFDECRRLSDDSLLVLPGEEANAPVSLKGGGRETGHWLDFFPKPVYWTMVRGPGQPFEEEVPPYGKVYHVGGPDDMARLLSAERGLAWAAHPRIKGSNFTPDAYRDEPLYRSDLWLGGAWKAMPADLSRDRLGERVLGLLDDMANWGQRKYAPGEVDVFRVDHTHELYGHMNVNYLRLDAVPKFADDWSPVLDALRRGRFFVTTGEVLLTEFTAGGKASGETLAVGRGGPTEVAIGLRWTFPLAFAEVVSGDGTAVYRERITLGLTDRPAFDRATIRVPIDLTGRRWVRVEAWDVAANGAFSQPVWLEPAP